MPSFRQPVAVDASLSDAEFLGSLAWEKGTPAAIVNAARSGDPLAFGKLLRQHARSRMSGQKPPKMLLADWSRPAETPASLATVLDALSGQSKPGKKRSAIKPQKSWTERVQPLLQVLTDPASDALKSPTGLLAALELLQTVGPKLPQSSWWPLWRATLSASLAHVAGFEQSSVPQTSELDVRGEIPVLVGLAFPEIAGASQLLRQGRKVLSRELTSRTDSDGTPHAELLPVLPRWLAPLIRVTSLSDRAESPLWDDEDQELLSNVCERAVALCRADGRLALTNGAPCNPLPILAHAAELFDWQSSNPSLLGLKAMQDHLAGQTRGNQRALAVSIMPSNQSDWARLAVMRSDWSASAASITIAHHAPLPQLDVSIGGKPLVHGPWDLRIRSADAELQLAEEWSCACWESQPDADFAELQMSGAGKLRVERLVLLSREDQFLMLIDSISGAPAGRIEYSSRLRLAPDVLASMVDGKRMARLQTAKARATLVPLALPSSVVHSTPHQFQITPLGIELHQVVEGQGMLAPLVIDFHPDRKNKDAEWRSLTVTENGAVVGKDTAAAYRWKIGKGHFFFYRSLKTPTTPRAALGYHTANETVIGRVDAGGGIDPILMVEA